MIIRLIKYTFVSLYQRYTAACCIGAAVIMNTAFPHSREDRFTQDDFIDLCSNIGIINLGDVPIVHCNTFLSFKILRCPCFTYQYIVISIIFRN
jgi:hypothetical protein